MNRPFLQGEPTSFNEIFHSVKSLALTGKEYGDFQSMVSIIPAEQRSTFYYTASNLPAKIACSNPRCQQGGYKLQWIIDGIVRNLDTHYENTFYCNGHEGSPKGRNKGDSCCNYIKITMELEYKNESDT